MRLFVLPSQNLVFQPEITIPMFLDSSDAVKVIRTTCEAGANDKMKQVVMVPNAKEGLQSVGTIANVLQILHLPDGMMQVVLETLAAANLTDFQRDNGIITAEATPIDRIDDSNHPVVLGMRDMLLGGLEFMSRVCRRSPDMPKLRNVAKKYPLNALIDAVVHELNIPADDAVRILMQTSFAGKLTILLEKVQFQIKLAKIEGTIFKKVNSSIAKNQREAFLREKLAAVQKELGEISEDGDGEGGKSLKKRIEESKMPADARKKAEDELKKMQTMHHHDAAMVKTYLDELLSMPWGKSDTADIDLAAAKAALDSDHFGMENVKERILEHLAVMKRTGGAKGTILCLVGAPGVGKTSLGKSIANALGRKYQRISLGGVSDEAHFRGHRRTYIGSQPGRIMDALKRAGADNPVIVLDEIDKMGRDYRGDPEAALLEILDPEQNKTFRDHYLEVDFDLSNVMFIATANSLKMSPALLDRMEIIEMPNYTADEKVEIAKRHLLPGAAADTGWNPAGIKIGDDAIRHIIDNYTNESGVRNLRRELTALLRRALYKTNCELDSYEFTTEKVGELLKNIRPEIGRKIGFRTTTTGIRL